jgi:hypothetical protein
VSHVPAIAIPEKAIVSERTSTAVNFFILFTSFLLNILFPAKQGNQVICQNLTHEYHWIFSKSTFPEWETLFLKGE